MTEVLIKYYGHSCFSITGDDYTIVIDPYQDDCVPGLKPLELSANLAIASHNHEDHDALSKIKIMKSAFRNPFTITSIPVAHDDCNGEKRGMVNINIFEYGDIRIAHFGDIGCLLDVDNIDKLKGIDVALIPVGGFYTIDKVKAKTIIEKIQCKIAVPMHYRTGNYGYAQIDTLDSFLSLYENQPPTLEELKLPSDLKGIVVLENMNK